MRENLFRGKPKDETQHYFFSQIWKDNCVDGFVYGSLVVDKDRCFIAISALCSINSFINNGIISMIEVIPETVGQYTGLTDKNGKKIFENDTCRFREWNNGDMCWIGKVYYEHQQFMISGESNKECEIPFHLALSRFVSENIEVIDNTHDNSEPLKGGV